MTQCKTCRWRDRCDLDCGDPQGFSYEPIGDEERDERDEEDNNENKEDNDGK